MQAFNNEHYVQYLLCLIDYQTAATFFIFFLLLLNFFLFFFLGLDYQRSCGDVSAHVWAVRDVDLGEVVVCVLVVVRY